MPRIFPFILLVVLTSNLPPLTSQASAEADRPNILWVTCEDMSPYLGCYGDAFATTPNLDHFSERAIRYTNAWSTMPICAPARSTLVTGVYSIALGSMNLRSIVPQSPRVIPLPLLLRRAGYFCTNDRKTDYNFSAEGLWDENGAGAHWRNRPDPGQPFFHVVNFQQTHEGPTNSLQEIPNLPDPRHDPEQVPLSVHLPDTPGMRTIVAHHYDLITAMDNFFGSVLEDLVEDRLDEDTLVFFFSDHGAGLPRHKRWLYETGLKVPLLVHIPDKWSHLAPQAMGTVSEDRVGFVDLPATVLELAGLPPHPTHQGQVFLGPQPAPDGFNFGARDRADDVEDLSRCVRDERYLYIRNYMPFRPYVRNAVIFGTQKGSYKEVKAKIDSGNARPELLALFLPKPFEELYDLREDPDELKNLANDPNYREIKKELHRRLNAWTLEIRDAAFLPEGEMMRRAAHDSVFDMAQDPRRYDLSLILMAAERSSRPDTRLDQFAELSLSSEMGVRYWAANGLLGRPDLYPASTVVLDRLLHDRNPSVSIVAAEAILTFNPDRRDALDLLVAHLSDHITAEPTIALRAARALAEIGETARPALPMVQELFPKIAGDVWGRYLTWQYPMFIGMSLDQVQMNLGIRVERYE